MFLSFYLLMERSGSGTLQIKLRGPDPERRQQHFTIQLYKRMVAIGWLTCCGEKLSKECNPPLLLPPLPLPPLEVCEFSVLSSRPFQGFYLLRAV